ncbi:hypothetical protein [Streptomyces sp. NPDC058674]|uniref:hypothetical protein n=1 Tax=Streptomyces sp. NPDC058674 TaxID=3346592 RepID=UPI00365B4291
MRINRARISAALAGVGLALALTSVSAQPAAAAEPILYTCVLQQDSSYFIVTLTDGVPTLQEPLSPTVAFTLLALGIPRC